MWCLARGNVKSVLGHGSCYRHGILAVVQVAGLEIGLETQVEIGSRGRWSGADPFGGELKGARTQKGGQTGARRPSHRQGIAYGWLLRLSSAGGRGEVEEA